MTCRARQLSSKVCDSDLDFDGRLERKFEHEELKKKREGHRRSLDTVADRWMRDV